MINCFFSVFHNLSFGLKVEKHKIIILLHYTFFFYLSKIIIKYISTLAPTEED